MVDAPLRDRPIGVFDSGLGGLTVVRELSAAMPQEDIVYLGDSARVPYGIKSLETVRRFALEDLGFLLQHEPKLIVAACNTASAAAIDVLEQASPVPVVDVVRPGAAAALTVCDEAQITDRQAVGVIATEATIASGAYQRAIAAIQPDRQVIAAACPLLVPIVEEGRDPADPIVLHVLGDYLRDMQRHRPAVLILGCTHYQLLTTPIAKLMGPDVRLINSARAAARKAQDQLQQTQQRTTRSDAGSLRCYTTDNPDRFRRLGRRFGGRTLNQVEYVGTDELPACQLAIEYRRA